MSAEFLHLARDWICQSEQFLRWWGRLQVAQNKPTSYVSVGMLWEEGGKIKTQGSEEIQQMEESLKH